MKFITPRECWLAVRDTDDPRPWLWLHFWLTVGWFLQFPLVFWYDPSLQRSIPYLVGISIAAAALGQLSSWQAARVEVRLWRHTKDE